MEGADCADAEAEEQAVLLVDDTDGKVTVVQPNEDGSYWRKIVRNKMIRMKEKRREQAGKEFARELFGDAKPSVVSSWGPYTSIVGTAKTTGVPGVTKEERNSAAEAKMRKWSEMGKEIKAAFDELDADSSGDVDAKELLLALQRTDPNANAATAKQLVDAADTDGDGRISLPEFAAAVLFGEAEAAKKDVKATATAH